ncbi:MAG: hypothetical protein JKY62_01005 [Desulfocapsa sp.]|nr:hypothetical protein [Desulfocapsa sp.]
MTTVKQFQHFFCSSTTIYVYMFGRYGINTLISDTSLRLYSKALTAFATMKAAAEENYSSMISPCLGTRALYPIDFKCPQKAQNWYALK